MVDSVLGPAEYVAGWFGTDSVGNEVSSGVYFYRGHFCDTTYTRKMVLLR